MVPTLATIALIIQGDHLCLCKKATGEFGAGTLIPPGGKCEHAEFGSPRYTVVREVIEETSFILRPEPEYLEWVGLLMTFLRGHHWFSVHVYRSLFIAGRWHTRPEMGVEWHHTSDLPYDRMRSSDRFWMPRALSGKQFVAFIHYGENEHDLKHIDLQKVD